MSEYRGVLQNECDGCVPMTNEFHVLCPACDGTGKIMADTCGLCLGNPIIDTRQGLK